MGTQKQKPAYNNVSDKKKLNTTQAKKIKAGMLACRSAIQAMPKQ